MTTQSTDFDTAVKVFKDVYGRLPNPTEREGLGRHCYYAESFDEDELMMILETEKTFSEE